MNQKGLNWMRVGIFPLMVLSFPTVLSSKGLFCSIDESSLPVNVAPPVQMQFGNDRNLTIFELVLLNKLQNFVEDKLGIEQFIEPFWVRTDYLKNLLESAKWNVQKAQTKFMKATDWRKRKLSDMKSLEMPEYLLTSFPVHVEGYDKQGCPMIILPVGEWRTYRSYVEKVKSIHDASNYLRKYFAILIEQLLEEIKQSESSSCSQFTLIADMNKYTSLHSTGIAAFLNTIKLFEASYPGILKIAYIINGNPTFLKVAQAFKSAVPPDLRRKAFLYTEKAFWQDVLLESIDHSQLPLQYGGHNATEI